MAISRYLLFDREGIKYVLKDGHKNFHKSFGYDEMEKMLGKGLVTSEGDLWRKQRRLMAPEFHRRKILTYTQSIIEITQNFIEQLKKHDGPFKLM